jgi:ATP synthase protein I
VRLPHLDGPRTAPLTTLAAAAVSAVAGLRAGVDGAGAGALLAGVMVVLFFWIGALPVLLVGGNVSLAGPGFLLLMTTYVARLVGLAVVLTVAGRSDAVDRTWLAGTLIACTLVWVGTQVALLGRSRVTL